MIWFFICWYCVSRLSPCHWEPQRPQLTECGRGVTVTILTTHSLNFDNLFSFRNWSWNCSVTILSQCLVFSFAGTAEKCLWRAMTGIQCQLLPFQILISTTSAIFLLWFQCSSFFSATNQNVWVPLFIYLCHHLCEQYFLSCLKNFFALYHFASLATADELTMGARSEFLSGTISAQKTKALLCSSPLNHSEDPSDHPWVRTATCPLQTN